jgi:hypothetical protein
LGNENVCQWDVGCHSCGFDGVNSFGKEKRESALPELVVKAQSVAVLILPGTRESIADPVGNRRAQEDIEKAFMKWGAIN